MGDFNYGGSYVSSRLRDHLDIDQPPFVRLINNTDGTTVKPFDPTPRHPRKPYDRIYAVPGDSTITAVGVDTFRDTLTPEQVASYFMTFTICHIISWIDMQYYKSVSDHYPVYVEVSFGNNGGTLPSSECVQSLTIKRIMTLC